MDIHLFVLRLPENPDESIGETLCMAADAQKKKLYIESEERKYAFPSVTAQVMLRYAVAKLLGISMREVSVLYTDERKPYVENEGVFVSISHTENLCVCAVADVPIGVDAEKIRPFPRRVAEKYFTDAEKDRIATAENEDKACFEIWTEHESYTKLTGDGLRAIRAEIPWNVYRKNMVYEEEYCISYCAFTNPS